MCVVGSVVLDGNSFEKYYSGRVGCHDKSKLVRCEMGAGLGTNISSLQLFFFMIAVL